MAGLPWFRMYHEMIEDPKIGLLEDAEFRLWVELLCIACSAGNSGDTDLSEEELTWKLRRNVTSPLQKLFRNGLVLFQDHKKERKTICIKNWVKRQFQSDSSTNRVRKYRNKQQIDRRNVSETLQERQCNAVDTDTDTDTEQIKKKDLLSDSPESDKKEKPVYPESFEKFWVSYPKKEGKGAAYKSYQKIKAPRPTLKIILDSIETHQRTGKWKDKQYIPQPARYLNERRWEDEFTPEDFNGTKPATGYRDNETTPFYHKAEAPAGYK